MAQLKSYGDKHLPFDTAVASVRKTVNALKTIVHPDSVQRCYDRSRFKEKFSLDQLTEMFAVANRMLNEQGNDAAE